MSEQQELTQSTQGAGPEGASQEVAQQPVAQGGEQRQPDGAQQQEQKQPVDLTQFEEFRRYQAKQDQQLAQLRRELEQQKRAAEEAQRQAEERMLAEMDDYERVQYERDKYMRMAQEAQLQAEYQRALAYRDQQLTQISQETGVPREQLDASSPEAAWQSAVRYLRQQQQQSVQQEARQLAQKHAANTVDVGGGAPATVDARWRAQQQKILNGGGTAVDYFRSAFRQVEGGD